MESASGHQFNFTFRRKCKGPRLNDSRSLMRTKNLLNTSRKILQKSMNQSANFTSLRSNNVSLAKKVTELQIELSNQRLSNQATNAELIKCRMELVHLRAFNEREEKIRSQVVALRELTLKLLETGMSLNECGNEMASVLRLENNSDTICSFLSQSKANILIANDQLPDVNDATKTFHLGYNNMSAVASPHCSVFDDLIGQIGIATYTSVPTTISTTLTNVTTATTACITTTTTTTTTSAVIEIGNTNLMDEAASCNTSKLNAINEAMKSNTTLPEVQAQNCLGQCSPTSLCERNQSIACVKHSCDDVKPDEHATTSAEVSQKESSPAGVCAVDTSKINARQVYVRQARLNSKPIIDQPSTCDLSMSMVQETKPKKKHARKSRTHKRRRLVHVSDSDDDGDFESNQAECLKHNLDGQTGTERVVETRFTCPGKLVFRAESKHRLTGSHQTPTAHTNKSTTLFGAKCHHNENTENVDPATGKQTENIPANKPKDVFDLSLNQTANISILPASLNELRQKQQGGRGNQLIKPICYSESEPEPRPVFKQIPSTKRQHSEGTVEDKAMLRGTPKQSSNNSSSVKFRRLYLADSPVTRIASDSGKNHIRHSSTRRPGMSLRRKHK